MIFVESSRSPVLELILLYSLGNIWTGLRFRIVKKVPLLQPGGKKPFWKGLAAPAVCVLSLIPMLRYLSLQLQCLHYITKTRPCNVLQFFTVVKLKIFRKKNCDFFLVFARNMGWTHLGTEAFLTGAHALYFRAKIGRKCKPKFC